MGACVFEFYEMLQPKNIEVYPEQVNHIIIPTSDFGTPNKKRVRVWPIVIDTFSHDVTFTPIIDCVNGTPLTINTDCKKTVFYFFKTDVFGIDYAAELEAGTDYYFELWQMGTPEIVQVLPIAKQFDQIGPEELFEYGKIRAFEFRIIAFGGTSIPIQIYFEDNTNYSTTLTVDDSKEGSYRVSIPKTVAGTIMRVELGPTAFNFHRFYTRVQVMLEGRQNTENEWLTLGSQNEK